MLCWSFRPGDRPDFVRLLNILDKLPKKRLARSPSHPIHLSRSAESVFWTRRQSVKKKKWNKLPFSCACCVSVASFVFVSVCFAQYCWFHCNCVYLFVFFSLERGRDWCALARWLCVNFVNNEALPLVFVFRNIDCVRLSVFTFSLSVLKKANKT